MKKVFLRTLLLTAASLSFAACQPAESPTEPFLESAWIRAMPPGMKMTAGFGTLNNVTDEKIEVESFSSPQFRKIELHLSEVVDGVSRMSEVDSLSLCAGESLEMAPGGYHLMLMGPLANIGEGLVVELEIHAADGRVFRYGVPVEKR